MRCPLIIALLVLAGCRGVAPDDWTASRAPQPGDFASARRLVSPYARAHVEPDSGAPGAGPVVSAVHLERLPAVRAVSPASHLESDAEVTVPVPENLPPSDAAYSLEQLEQLALANSPAVAEAAAGVQAARGQWVQVGLPPNPLLGYSGQQLGSDGAAEQQGVFIGQEIVTGHKLRLNRHVAAWSAERAEQLLATQQQRVVTDVRVAYYEVLIAQRRRELARQLVQVGEQAVRAAEALFRAGDVSEADPLRARIEADSAAIVLRNAENQYLATWRTLAAAVGTADLAPAELQGDLDPAQVDPTWEDQLAQLLSESPEMAAGFAGIEAAHWSLCRARVEAIPNLDVQAIVQRDNATASSNGNLQVTVPIPLLNRNQGRIQQAQAELAAAQLAVDRLALDLQSRLADSFQRYSSARYQVERYTAPGGILDSARRTMELIRTGYQVGEFGVLELLSAQRTYFQTNLAYLDSLRDYWIAAMEIRGLLLRGSLASR
jgi:cobalt-zinc-cadmium efflux system outer membrane protein